MDVRNSSRVALPQGLESPSQTPVSGRQGAHKVDNWTRFKSDTSLSFMEMRSSLYKCTSVCVKPFSETRSQYYAYRSAYTESKIYATLGKEMNESEFGSALRAPAMNIAAKQTYQKFKETLLEKNQLVKKVALAEGQKTGEIKDLIALKGICKGISINLASRFLNGEPTANLIHSLKKGADVDAEVNQAIYTQISQNNDPKTNIDKFFTFIEEDKTSLKKDFSGVDQERTQNFSDAIGAQKIKNGITLLFELDKLNDKIPIEKLKSLEEDAEKTIKTTNNLDKFGMQPLSTELGKSNFVIHLVNSAIINHKDEFMIDGALDYQKLGNVLIADINRRFSTDMSAIDAKAAVDQKAIMDKAQSAIEENPAKKWEIKVKAEEDLIKVQERSKKAKLQLLATRQTFIKEIKIAIAFQRSSNYSADAIDSDSLVIKEFVRAQFMKRGDAIAAERGVALKPVAIPDRTERIMGQSDKKDLEAILPNLEAGFYSIDFSTKQSAHAISLVMEQGGRGYIVDPNIGSLEFNNPQKCQELMEKLLKRYSSPKSNLIPHAADESRSYHNLRFFKCELKSPNSSTSA